MEKKIQKRTTKLKNMYSAKNICNKKYIASEKVLVKKYIYR